MQERSSNECPAEEGVGRKQTLCISPGSGELSLTLDYPHCMCSLAWLGWRDEKWPCQVGLWNEGNHPSLVLLLTEELT